mgnify:CR=1 FL=1
MVKSPCVAVCKIDHESGYCIGCNRTIEEITDWSSMNDSNKKKVLIRVKNNTTFQSKISPSTQDD